MARGQHKSKTPPRQLSNAEIKAALKFAKERGFTKVDLRKKPNAYRKKIAAKFAEASKAPALYQAVTIKNRKARHGFDLKGYTTGRDKVLVKKQATYESVRVTSNSEISVKNRFFPEFNEIIKPAKLREPKAGEVIRVYVGKEYIDFHDYDAYEDWFGEQDSDSDYGAEIVSTAVS